MCLWYHTVVSYELSFRITCYHFNNMYNHHGVEVRVIQVLCCWNYYIKCYENGVISMKYISQVELGSIEI